MQVDGSNNSPCLVALDFQNWQGGTQSDLISFIKRKSRITLQNPRVNGPVLTAFVPERDVSIVTKLNGIRFAGQALQISAQSSASTANATIQTVDVLTGFLNSRYNASAQLLNLSNMGQDPVLLERGMLANPTTATKMFMALMKMAKDNLPGVRSVSLETNQLTDISSVQSLSTSFPNLENLSLANNMLPNFQALLPWRNRFPKLRELVIQGNPLLNDPNSQREIVNMFPRLVMLDGVTVRNEADLPRDALPMPVLPTFFETPEIQNLSQSFLAEFLRCWDTDRSQLLGLYDDASMFSMCYNTNTPKLPSHQPTNRRGPNPNTPYTSTSRNLAFSNTSATRNQRLAIGRNAILTVFQKLPATKHDLSQAHKFAIDGIALNGVRSPQDSAISVSIHGEMLDVTSNLTRSFDRTLVILPSPVGGSFVIASDMLTIRSAAGSDAFTSPRAGQSANVTPHVTPATTPTPAPTGATPDPSTAETLVHQLMAQTGLTLKYAQECLQQANFDLGLALNLFQQSRSQLPPDAFAQ